MGYVIRDRDVNDFLSWAEIGPDLDNESFFMARNKAKNFVVSKSVRIPPEYYIRGPYSLGTVQQDLLVYFHSFYYEDDIFETLDPSIINLKSFSYETLTRVSRKMCSKVASGYPGQYSLHTFKSDRLAFFKSSLLYHLAEIILSDDFFIALICSVGYDIRIRNAIKTLSSFIDGVNEEQFREFSYEITQKNNTVFKYYIPHNRPHNLDKKLEKMDLSVRNECRDVIRDILRGNDTPENIFKLHSPLDKDFANITEGIDDRTNGILDFLKNSYGAQFLLSGRVNVASKKQLKEDKWKCIILFQGDKESGIKYKQLTTGSARDSLDCISGDTLDVYYATSVGKILKATRKLGNIKYGFLPSIYIWKTDIYSGQNIFIDTISNAKTLRIIGHIVDLIQAKKDIGLDDLVLKTKLFIKNEIWEEKKMAVPNINVKKGGQLVVNGIIGDNNTQSNTGTIGNNNKQTTIGNSNDVEEQLLEFKEKIAQLEELDKSQVAALQEIIESIKEAYEVEDEGLLRKAIDKFNTALKFIGDKASAAVDSLIQNMPLIVQVIGSSNMVH